MDERRNEADVWTPNSQCTDGGVSSGRFLFHWAEAGEEVGVFCDLSQDGAHSSTWKPSSFILQRVSERSSKVHLKSRCDLDTVVAAALHEVGFLHGRMGHSPVIS